MSSSAFPATPQSQVLLTAGLGNHVLEKTKRISRRLWSGATLSAVDKTQVRARDLGTEDTLSESVFPGFLRRAQSRHDIVSADRFAIPFGPLLVGWKFARPHQGMHQSVGCQLVSVGPALVPIIQMADDDEGPVGIAVEQFLDVPAVFAIATFRQVQITMQTALACRVPGSSEVSANQVNDIGTKLLHVVKIEGGVVTSSPTEIAMALGGRDANAVVTKSRSTVLLRPLASPAWTATPSANTAPTLSGAKRSHRRSAGARAPSPCKRAARPNPETIANSRSDSMQKRPRTDR